MIGDRRMNSMYSIFEIHLAMVYNYKQIIFYGKRGNMIKRGNSKKAIRTVYLHKVSNGVPMSAFEPTLRFPTSNLVHL